MPIKRSSGRLGSIGGGFNNNSSRRTSDQLISSVPLVKHCIFPVVPKLSSISFLSFSLVLCLTSTLIQHMNLYQTVWWLRNTSIEYPIEFDLIDCYVITHILLMLCTPYVYLILIKFIPSLIMTSLIIRSLVGLCIFTYWGYIMTWILNQIEYSGTPIMHHPLGMVLLTYFPILTLLVYHSRYLEKVVCQNNRLQHHHHHHSQLNNTDHNSNCSCYRDNNTRITYQSSVFTLKYCLQLFTSSCWRCLTLFTDWPCLPFKEMFFPIPYKFIPSRLFYHQHHDDNASTTNDHHASISTIDYQTMDPVDDSNHYIMMNHQCLGVTPDQTRDEVELYRRDFNARLTDIFIGTLHAVYYGCFLPIIFVQNEHLHIDYWWCLQHCCITGLLVFLLRWHYFLPCDYIDLLHRSSMHLGNWESLHARSGYTNAIPWSASIVYPCGVVVKHMRGLFRSVGINNCAEPGNQLHSRFYFLFNNPKCISYALLCLTSFTVFYACFSSYWLSEWYKLIGLLMQALFCLLNLFLHSRTVFLVYFVYSASSASASSASSSSPKARLSCSLVNYFNLSTFCLFSSTSAYGGTFLT